jgi:hypothetical protein
MSVQIRAAQRDLNAGIQELLKTAVEVERRDSISAKISNIGAVSMTLLAVIFSLAVVGAVALTSVVTGLTPSEIVTSSADIVVSTVSLVSTLCMDYIVTPSMDFISSISF